MPALENRGRERLALAWRELVQVPQDSIEARSLPLPSAQRIPVEAK
jgi:hypothetical protein